jgi:transcriptional regulator with XRE-family HTH domain
MSTTLGDRITSLRKAKGLSQTDLAKEADVSREALSKYERNEIVPSVQVAARIAETLGVTLDYLIGNAHELAVDKQTLKRIREIEALDNGTKSTLFTIIDTFLRDAKARKAYA